MSIYSGFKNIADKFKILLSKIFVVKKRKISESNGH